MTYPVSDVIEGLEQLRSEAAVRRDAGFRLAAALFAVLVDLGELGGLSLGIEAEDPLEPAPNLDEEALATPLSIVADADALYRTLRARLRGWLRTLKPRFAAIEARAPGSIPLASIWPTPPAGTNLVGEVAWWVRPPARLAEALREGARHPARMSYPFLPHGRAQVVDFHWARQHTITHVHGPADPGAPDPATHLAGVRPGGDHRLVAGPERALRVQRRFRIGLAPLLREAWPVFRVVDEGTGPAITTGPELGTNAANALDAHLGTLLDHARDLPLDLLVLPELVVDLGRREHLASRLPLLDGPLLGVLAGSTHVTAAPGRRHNQAALYGRDGDGVFYPKKFGYYRATGRELQGAWEHRVFFREDPGLAPDGTRYHEWIQRGQALHFLDTTLGRVAVLICSDALDPCSGYRDRIVALRTDVVFVLSMSEKSDRFAAIAGEWAEAGISTFYVNARCVVPDEGTLAFYRLAIPEPDADRPVSVRWRPSGIEAQIRGSGRWFPWAPPPGAPVFLFGDGDGLAVDLGAWLAPREPR
jgi:hypothetical protein